MGRAALHLHSTHSDGRGTVQQIMDHLDLASNIDLVSITDHDEIAGFEEAREWVDQHPRSRLNPVWGCEVTTAGFKHLLAYVFQPPYPSRRFPAFRPLEDTLRIIHDAGGIVVAAHPDTFWVGVGLSRLGKIVDRFPVVVGVEAYNPYCRSAPNIEAFARDHNLAVFGGSDAHFMEHLLKYVLTFPGQSPSDLHRALKDRTTTAIPGPPCGRVPVGELLAQQVQSLVVHPSRKLRRAMVR